MLYELFLKATELVEALGYLGIFIMSFIEGTFIPIPSEITLIPAGYLVAKGSLKMSYVLISGISGTLGGAIFSYTIAFHFGRAIFIKYGKYFFMDEKKLSKLEDFMAKYGNISVFLGRVLPGIKHFISFPAGLGKMDPKLFCFYSTCGSGVWASFLILLGYFIGDNEALINQYLKQVNFILLLLLAIITLFFLIKKHFAKKNEDAK